MYVDVLTHLTHERFSEDLPQVLENCEKAGLGAVVVNGLDPWSNDDIQTMATESPVVVPAAGIYPVQAVCEKLPDDFPYEVKKFSVSQEISRIENWATEGKIKAVGECGIDGYMLDESYRKDQEKVFENLLGIAYDNNMPIIIHSRKLEKRCLEMVAAHGNSLVDFHCFCGKTKLAQQAAEKYGWCFSIPANARKSGNFEKMLRTLPEHSILTETDAPYLAPIRGERNDPTTVIQTVEFLAEIKEWPLERAKDLVWGNYKRLFNLV